MKKESKDKNIIEVDKETQIGDYILEKGDKVEVLNEEKLNEDYIETMSYQGEFMSELLEKVANSFYEWMKDTEENYPEEYTDEVIKEAQKEIIRYLRARLGITFRLSEV